MVGMKKEKAPLPPPFWAGLKLRDDFLPYSLIFLGVFLFLSLLSFRDGDYQTNWFGRIGYGASFVSFFLFGKASYALSGFFFLLGFYTLKEKKVDILGKLLFLPVLLVALSVALFILDGKEGNSLEKGGVIGQFFSWVFEYLFGETGRALFVTFLFLYASLVLLQDSFSWTDAIHRGLSFLGKKAHPYYKKLSTSLSYAPEDLQNHEIQRKSWVERKTAPVSDSTAFPEPELNIPTMDSRSPLSLDEESILSSRKNWTELQTPIVKRRFRNASMYDGFFEEKDHIFRFQKSPTSFVSQEKEKFSPKRYSHLQVIDLRKEEKEESFVQNYVSQYEKEMISKYKDLEEELNNEISTKQASSESIWQEISSEDLEGFVDAKENFESLDEGSIESSEVEELTEEEFEENEETLLDLEPEAAISELIPEESVYEKPIQIADFKAKQSEKWERELQSSVPKPNLKKGTYYVSTKLLGDHKRPAAIAAVWEKESDFMSRRIEEIILQFGIESKVIGKERGPIITRYELTIPHGVKLGKITSLSDELKLHLSVLSIRIVAPIPGKSSIGIEVPNKNREDVFLSEILKETILQNKAKDLTIAIGKDISGKTVLIDLAKLPHLLVAGTTGSGKSVCLNSMITSLICTRSPEEVRFIMIDPKMVEMSLYEDIPHLLMPVITDPKRATKALSWAIQEMEARYQIVSKLKSRDFKSYNEKVEEYGYKKGFEKFPYIVIFIDELADLMMVSGKELEDQITRISQKSRAVGIHLVMATQRPSVDVITGLIKANCPARVAFHVAQKTDSRTILDTNGAEALLGKGDFLYRSPTSADLARIQAPYVEEKEIEAIVEEAKRLGNPSYVEMTWETETETEEDSEVDEELFAKAWNVVLTDKKASGSYLQRRLRIGYNKAALLMELMEARGYVSPQIGTKPREILRSA